MSNVVSVWYTIEAPKAVLDQFERNCTNNENSISRAIQEYAVANGIGFNPDEHIDTDFFFQDISRKSDTRLELMVEGYHWVSKQVPAALAVVLDAKVAYYANIPDCNENFTSSFAVYPSRYFIDPFASDELDEESMMRAESLSSYEADTTEKLFEMVSTIVGYNVSGLRTVLAMPWVNECEYRPFTTEIQHLRKKIHRTTGQAFRKN